MTSVPDEAWSLPAHAASTLWSGSLQKLSQPLVPSHNQHGLAPALPSKSPGDARWNLNQHRYRIFIRVLITFPGSYFPGIAAPTLSAESQLPSSLLRTALRSSLPVASLWTILLPRA